MKSISEQFKTVNLKSRTMRNSVKQPDVLLAIELAMSFNSDRNYNEFADTNWSTHLRLRDALETTIGKLDKVEFRRRFNKHLKVTLDCSEMNKGDLMRAVFTDDELEFIDTGIPKELWSEVDKKFYVMNYNESVLGFPVDMRNEAERRYMTLKNIE